MKTYPYKTNISSIIKDKEISGSYFEGLASGLYPDAHLTEKSYSDYLVQVPAEYDVIWAKLNQVLVKALGGIVSNYFKMAAIRDIYALPEEFENILRIADGQPYQVGMFRPDFLLESRTLQPKLCEIGLRYPVNGWICSYVSQQVLSKLNAAHNLNIETQNQQLSFPDAIASSFRPFSQIALIDGKDNGTEAFSLINILEEKGFRFLRSTPEDVTLENNVITVAGEACDQFIMELDRTKLSDFNQEVLKKIITSGYSINDVRSLILVHDKRVLAVLYQDSIMKKILSDDELNFLKPFLIPTFSLHDTSVHADILTRKNNWIFKKNSGGRGIDACQSADMTDTELSDFLSSNYPHYTGQHFLDQAIINMPDPHYMVGILLQFNNLSFGAGIFRGGFDTVINISSGNGKIYPTIFENA